MTATIEQERVAWRNTDGKDNGVPDRRVMGDLERFKQFIESRGEETGGWRGEIPREG